MAFGWAAALAACITCRLDAFAILRTERGTRHAPGEALFGACAAAHAVVGATAALLVARAVTSSSLLPPPKRDLAVAAAAVAAAVLGALATRPPLQQLAPRLRALVGGLARCAAAPLVPPRLADGLLADVLTSLAGALHTLPAVLCALLQLITAGASTTYVTLNPNAVQSQLGLGEIAGTPFAKRLECDGSGRLVAAFAPLFLMWPFVVRLMQCLRQVRDNRRDTSAALNALKYACFFPRAVLQTLYARSVHAELGGAHAATLFRGWVAAAVLNSAYSTLWDMYRDWDCVGRWPWRLRAGLGGGSKQVPSRAAFRAALLWNAAARHAWCVWLLPTRLLPASTASAHRLALALQLVELARRSVWLVFRLENASRGRALRTAESYAHFKAAAISAAGSPTRPTSPASPPQLAASQNQAATAQASQSPPRFEVCTAVGGLCAALYLSAGVTP